jgi:hypothetical protein
MRTTIARIVLGLLLLSFVACSEKEKKPNTEAFDPKAEMKKAPEAPKLPKPPGGGDKANPPP